MRPFLTSRQAEDRSRTPNLVPGNWYWA